MNYETIIKHIDDVGGVSIIRQLTDSQASA